MTSKTRLGLPLVPPPSIDFGDEIHEFGTNVGSVACGRCGFVQNSPDRAICPKCESKRWVKAE